MQRRKTGTDKEKREALKAVVTQELANAEGNQTDALSANRESALQYYYGAKRGDEIEGRSQVISNIAFGGVVLCSGQSNMGFSANLEFNASAEIADRSEKTTFPRHFVL